MKKLITLSLISILFTLSLTAQQTRYQWVQTAGGSFITGGAGANNRLEGMAVDKEGNTYVTGTVSQGMTFGDTVINPPLASFGGFDGMIAKYDRCGKLLWYHVIGAKTSDYMGRIALSPNEKSLITLVSLSVNHNDTVILHMENKDTVIKSGYGCYLKFNTATGKIMKIWPVSIPYPTGATYQPSQITYISDNRIVAFPSLTGNYNGVVESGYEGIIAILDSNLNIIRSREIDSGLINYFANDYNYDRPPLEVDKYGNIYNETILSPSNPSSTLRLFDTVIGGLTNGDGLLFQLDSNLNLKRFKKSNCLMALSYSADDNMYMTGGLDNSFYYDTTYFNGNHSVTAPYNPIYIKVDTSMELKGFSYPSRTQYMQYTNLIKATTDKVYVCGLGFSDVKWGQDSIINNPNVYQMSLWEFPKDSVRPTKVHLSDGFGINTAFPEMIGVDEQGNVTIGGTYGLALYTAGDSVYAAGGSNSPNIYTMHWGLGCTDSTHALIAPLEPSVLVATATGTHAVQVAWHDDSQYEHSFHIYRSPDGISNWTRIDTVLSNTTQYIDVNVQPHTIYWYRVAAWNSIGESSFTNIDSALTWTDVGISEAAATLPYINAYPNPATDRITIEVYSIGAKDATLRLTDINGREVTNTTWSLSDGLNKTAIQMTGLSSGMYYLTIRTGSDIVTRKIAKAE